jgi:hypothetical protein
MTYKNTLILCSLTVFLMSCGNHSEVKNIESKYLNTDFNAKTPGVFLATNCQSDGQAKIPRKIKYLGLGTINAGHVIGDFIREAPCGKQKLTASDVDFGFTECGWTARGETNDGKEFVRTGKLEKGALVFLGGDDILTEHLIWLELVATL